MFPWWSLLSKKKALLSVQTVIALFCSFHIEHVQYMNNGLHLSWKLVTISNMHCSRSPYITDAYRGYFPAFLAMLNRQSYATPHHFPPPAKLHQCASPLKDPGPTRFESLQLRIQKCHIYPKESKNQSCNNFQFELWKNIGEKYLVASSIQRRDGFLVMLDTD